MIRCPHYQSDLDIVSIRFKCCGIYYPCYLCHSEAADHPAERWESSEFDAKAILWRNCKKELTIWQYFSCSFLCIACGANFNPGCQSHWNLYFNIGSEKPVV